MGDYRVQFRHEAKGREHSSIEWRINAPDEETAIVRATKKVEDENENDPGWIFDAVQAL